MAKKPVEINYTAAEVRRMKVTLSKLKGYLKQEKSRKQKNKPLIESYEETIKNLEYSISGKN